MTSEQKAKIRSDIDLLFKRERERKLRGALAIQFRIPLPSNTTTRFTVRETRDKDTGAPLYT